MSNLSLKLKTLVVILMLSLKVNIIYSHDFKVDNIYYNITSETDGTVEVTYKGERKRDHSKDYKGDVVVPQYVKHKNSAYKVTSIGDNAFAYSAKLSTISIPNTVNKIGEKAFVGCTSLSEINISDLSVWCKIEFRDSNENPLSKSAILKLNGLEITDLTIPNDVTEIKRYAFYGSKSLKSLTIPNTVKTIGLSAFEKCENLSTISIANSVTEIGYYAFKDCVSLLGPLTIPPSIARIEDEAFSGCSNLTTLNFNAKNCERLGGIGRPVFGNCTSLRTINIGSQVSCIPAPGFVNCKSLTTVNFNAIACEYMGDRNNFVFNNCPKFTTLNIGDSVIALPEHYAFDGCENLVNISIGKSVVDISLECFNETGWWERQPKGVVYLGDCCLGYKTGWFYGNDKLTGTVRIKEGTRVIGRHAFSRSDVDIEMVIIPNSVTTIGEWAFSYQEHLNYVIIGNSVTTIGGWAFSGCEWLNSIQIPNSVTTIGRGAFSGCKQLESIVIPNLVTEIAEHAFEGCAGLCEIIIGKGVTKIGNEAFNKCDNLTYITSLNPIPPIVCGNNEIIKRAQLYIPEKNYATYFLAECWKDFNWIIPLEPVNNIWCEEEYWNYKDTDGWISWGCNLIDVDGYAPLVWESDNPSVAVCEDGIIRGLSEGTATVTVRAVDESNLSASCKVVIEGYSITLSHDNVTLPVNGSMKLSYHTFTTTPVEWSCSNNSVVGFKENSDGSISIIGLSRGTATITVSTYDDVYKSDTCEVTVK